MPKYELFANGRKVPGAPPRSMTREHMTRENQRRKDENMLGQWKPVTAARKRLTLGEKLERRKQKIQGRKTRTPKNITRKVATATAALMHAQTAEMMIAAYRTGRMQDNDFYDYYNQEPQGVRERGDQLCGIFSCRGNIYRFITACLNDMSYNFSANTAARKDRLIDGFHRSLIRHFKEFCQHASKMEVGQSVAVEFLEKCRYTVDKHSDTMRTMVNHYSVYFPGEPLPSFDPSWASRVGSKIRVYIPDSYCEAECKVDAFDQETGMLTLVDVSSGQKHTELASKVYGALQR